jgi:arginyl-tRNA synthetase
VLRQAATTLADIDIAAESLAGAPLDLLVDEGEKGILKLIAQYPRQVEAAAAAHEPHRIAFYLHDLASAFHSHWNRGKDHPELRFVNEENRQLTKARLALVVSLTGVIASGLGILGVRAPEEMR